VLQYALVSRILTQLFSSQTNRPFCVKAYQGDNYVFSCGTKKLTTTYVDSGIGTLTAMPSAAPTTNSQPTKTIASTNPSSSMSSSVPSVSSTSPLATSPSLSTSTSSSTPALAQGGSMADSRGLIIGVIVGAAAGSILLLVLLFIVWKCWKRRRSGAERGAPKEKSNQAGYSLGSGEDSNTKQTNSQRYMGSGLSNSQGPAELEEQLHHPTNHNAVNGHPHSPEHIRGAAEAPSNAPVWSSPSIAMTSPTPSNSSLWMTTPGMGTPRASSHYVAYTPSSAYSASGQPPSSLPQPRYRDANTTNESPIAELEAHEVGRTH
jgi:hypothetical protein